MPPDRIGQYPDSGLSPLQPNQIGASPWRPPSWT